TATPFAGGRRGGFVRGSEGGQRAAADQVNIAQVIVTSIISTAELGIVAIGLTMTFSILRFANFAHASMAVIGAYIAYTFNVQLDMSLWLAFAAAMLVMGSFGIVVDRVIFRAMRNVGDLTPMIASLGLSLAIQYTVQAVWGPQFLLYTYDLVPGMVVFGARITGPQLGIICTVVVAMLCFHLLLTQTKIGKAMRATATNPDLAQACSIDIDHVIRVVWFVGTAFAAIGGMFIAWDTQLNPYFGFNLIIPVFCVVLIGGVGSIYGAMLGAVIVGFASNFGVTINWGPILAALGLADEYASFELPVAYKPGIAYLIVIILLLLRPSGLTKRELI
ncbi:MAG TPA: branched-chain amino acid ABC transporter permease, partial [Ktedonobacterales bacterium]|nr:branched-chain amino acid ABC transporter permease [Ktedonobacterales bacterium]